MGDIIIQHYPAWSVTTEKVYSGSRSLVFDGSKVTNTGVLMSCQSSATQSEFAGESGTYIVSAYIWKASGSMIDKLYFTFQFPNKQNILDISDVPFDTWHKVSIACDVPGELIVAKTKLNIQVLGTSTGMMYIDDIEVKTDTTRPMTP